MNIEKEIFKRANINFKKLTNFGFLKEGNIYKYSKTFMDDSFRADIVIDKRGEVSGKIYDISIDEEYTNFRVENQNGEFVNKVREEYKCILNEILKNCFDKNYFVTEQANRIAKLIIDMYGDEPEFPWEKYQSDGIFKNPNNGKWYGLIMNLDKSKIDKNSSGEIEILDLKLDSEIIPKLLSKKGFYPGYHMNKKNWITIILDDTLSDEEIIKYIKESHLFTVTSTEWIIPANPNYYDIINCFNDTDTIIWKQSNNIKVEDIVYIYVGSPYSAILYKCKVLEVNIPYEYKDVNINMKYAMKIKLLNKYDRDKYTFNKLNEFGIKAIRGPRNMPKKLSEKINKTQ